ncbi:hypothetical protein [Malikia granosa]|uniref:hypothetical protein n=1 Tax=Malikia granosa TaxID=263067 RepID=UPI0014742801|nr:hypothetical protein [Malikia granosa]
MKIIKKPTRKQIEASRSLVPISALCPGNPRIQPSTSKTAQPARNKTYPNRKS